MYSDDISFSGLSSNSSSSLNWCDETQVRRDLPVGRREPRIFYSFLFHNAIFVDICNSIYTDFLQDAITEVRILSCTRIGWYRWHAIIFEIRDDFFRLLYHHRDLAHEDYEAWRTRLQINNLFGLGRDPFDRGGPDSSFGGSFYRHGNRTPYFIRPDRDLDSEATYSS